MRVFALILIAFLSVGVVHADVYNKGHPSSVVSSKNDASSVLEKKWFKKIKVTHEIYGYEVDCSKGRFLVWGKSKSFNKDNPQESTLFVAGAKSSKNPVAIGFSKNIYNVYFLADGVTAVVESDTEWLIDAISGRVVSQTIDGSLNASEGVEVCDAFPNKSYRKYKS
jgi:hypothetical protein